MNVRVMTLALAAMLAIPAALAAGWAGKGQYEPDTSFDATGSYMFPDLSMGKVSLVVTLEGYQPWQLNNLPLPGNTLEDPWLVPVPPRNTNGVAATARCRDGAWSWELDQTLACKANGGIAYLVCPGPLCRPD